MFGIKERKAAKRAAKERAEIEASYIFEPVKFLDNVQIGNGVTYCDATNMIQHTSIVTAIELYHLNEDGSGYFVFTTENNRYAIKADWVTSSAAAA